MIEQKKGKLYLIPTALADGGHSAFFNPYQASIIRQLNYFLVENVRTARRYISSLELGLDIETLQFELLDKNTTELQAAAYMREVSSGRDAGIMSEAGCPGIADPGSEAVRLAHSMGIDVVPLVGPSSIFLALMASGFNGQQFSFHGYLPIDKGERKRAIAVLENAARTQGSTQIFMETPYRNNALLADLLAICQPHTRLCIASNLTAYNERVVARQVGEWKKNAPDLHKQPAIFLIGA